MGATFTAAEFAERRDAPAEFPFCALSRHARARGDCVESLFVCATCHNGSAAAKLATRIYILLTSVTANNETGRSLFQQSMKFHSRSSTASAEIFFLPRTALLICCLAFCASEGMFSM
jgi:hypothetical protein